ncbi:MAG: hypothetical protein H7177_12220 [Rhizobacter sp.]|nr:hypothetical protein [Bacteriovorax sp.]
MGTKNTFKLTRILNLSVLMGSLILSSCVQNAGVRAKSAVSGSSLKTGTTGTGTGSLPNNTVIGAGDTLQSVKVELSHLVDPIDGTYKKKVSIPKNYKGNLYIAGLNIAAVQDKLIKVRFNFGTDNQSVTLNATVARAPGIVPTTEIQVLVVDMNNKPFEKMRLGYDLYDYNDYTSNPSKAPVQDSRDSGLYCRGLNLVDDPTFDNTSTTATCSSTGSKCLYAYAKVTDATLYNASGITAIPTRPQVWTEASSVRSPTMAVASSSMCLPDFEDVNGVNTLFNLPTYLTGLASGTLVTDDHIVSGSHVVTYGAFYKGPYRAINQGAWNISGGALFSYSTTAGVAPTGLFELSYDGTVGYRSFLFPRAGIISLNQDVKYQGSTDRFGLRGNLVADSTGASKYVDGCNIRVMNYDPATTEGIQSCNVNGSIEVFYMKDGAEVSITKDHSIKLQLLKKSLLNSEGKEVLASAFKQCDTSSTCGSSECCFNKRCWSKELVTQCVDQVPVNGNRPVGEVCSSDYECSSLCCNTSTGSCQPHNPNGTVPVLCNKTAGQRCVSQEFCKPEFVATCKLTKLSTLNANGTVACAMRCPAISTYGSCTGGYCVPPAVPAIPKWDGVDCTGAVDP